MRYLLSTGTTNNRIIRTQKAQARRSLTAASRKSPVAKRMDRPHKLDKASGGYSKIETLMQRVTK
jgi:hypothetical protein